jgi:hypothetical protein
VLINADIISWARRHHGLVSLAGWTACGRSRSSFHRAVRAGLLVAVAPQVAALAGTVVGPQQRIAAGALSFGPDVVVSHRSAAWLWGAPIDEHAPVDLITRRRNHRTTAPGFVMHRPGDRATMRATTRWGLSTTLPVRTLLDVGAVASADVIGALEAFLVSAIVSMPTVVHTLERERHSGLAGVTALEAAVEELGAGAVLSDSKLERVASAVFALAGIDGWVLHDEIEGYEVDFGFQAERVVVEVDGWAWHGALRDRWERDRERDLVLAAAGWLVVRLTWRMMTRQPEAAAARLAAALAVRRPVA